MINKKCAASFATFAIFTAISFITLYIMSLFELNKWVGVISACCVLFVAMILVLLFSYLAAKLCIIALNAISCGLAASSMFTALGAYPPVWQTALLWVCLCALFIIYLLLCNFSFFRLHPFICIALFSLLLLGGFITGAVFDISILKLALLFWIVFVMFLATCAKKADGMAQHFKNLAICSFVMAIVIIIAVIIVVSQGDGLDGIADGFDIPSVDPKNKKRNPYNFTTLN